MTILGLDPGCVDTGWALTNEKYEVIDAGKMPSDEVAGLIYRTNPSITVCESLACYGIAVGREVFETAYWIGGYRQCCIAASIPFYLYPKPEYAPALAGVHKVTDSVLRQTLLLRFGGDKKGQPLFRLKGSSDQRSAFGVAVYHLDKHHLGVRSYR